MYNPNPICVSCGEPIVADIVNCGGEPLHRACLESLHVEMDAACPPEEPELVQCDPDNSYAWIGRA